MNASKFAVTVAAVVLIFKTPNLYGQGAIEAVNTPVVTGVFSTGAIFGYVNNGTIGWAFSPSQNIVISSLGWLAIASNPPPVGVSIGLWSTDGTLLRSSGIDGNAVLVNGNLYESVSPLSVSAGSTLVVAVGSSGENIMFVAFPGSPTQDPVNFAGTADLNGNGFEFPTVQSTIDDTDRVIPAASFLFQLVPEPNELVPAVTGAVLLSLRRRRNAMP